MTYIIAVSGGVDSVALLDMMVAAKSGPMIVAHFDHGIRDDSAEDARFVALLAGRYGLPFEAKREELGPRASEALARERRYAFLNEVAKKHNGKIVTAHHGDDVIESVAINLTRGTGWRGLAVMDSDIVRPLLGVTKDQIRQYVARRNLEWHEDSTNASGAYLRNRLRAKTAHLAVNDKKEIQQLHARQRELKKAIDTEVTLIIGKGPEYSRYLFSHMPKSLALECLRVVTKSSLTRPQMERALLAVKVAHPGTVFQAGSGTSLCFSTRYFTV